MKIEEILTETIFDEASLGRARSHIENRNVGLISASRSEFGVAENNKRTDQLKSDIIAAGFGFMNVTGSYVENLGKENETKVIERSFLVIGLDESNKKLYNFLSAEAAKFNQESFLYKTKDDKNGYLISPDGKVLSSVGEFHIGKLNDYSSKIKGKYFTFSEMSMESTILTKWASYGKITETKFFSVKKLTKISD
jgi:hypothetical protein